MDSSFAQTITSFTPKSGPTGQIGSTTITINGTGFSTTPSNNIVFFGAVYRPALTATETQLTVVAPTGVTYQFLSVVNLETSLKATCFAQNPFTHTFYNEGSIRFTPAASPDYTYNYGFTQPYFKLTDFDGDGKPDFVFYHAEDSTIGILRNTSVSGSVSFDDVNIVYTPVRTDDVFAFDIADMNNDGKPDIVTRSVFSLNVNGNATLLSIFPNTSTPGAISMGTRVDVKKLYIERYYPAGCSRDIGLADIDGDGKTDIVISMYNEVVTARLEVFRNKSNATDGIVIDSVFTKVNTSTNDYQSDQHGLNMADFDGDGKLDIGLTVVKSDATNNFLVFYNTSTPGSVSLIQPSAKIALGTSDAVHGSIASNLVFASAGDLDGDGLTDLAVANRGGRNLGSLRNLGVQGAGNFATRVTSSITTAPSWNRIFDLDGDGKPDIAATGLATNILYMRRNNSTPGTIDFSGNYAIPVQTSPQCFDVCDIDGDGRPDLVVISSAKLTVQRNLSKQISLRVPLPF